MLILLGVAAVIAESSDMPVLLPLGIVGLGSLTMASERWGGTATTVEAGPVLACADPVETDADLAA